MPLLFWLAIISLLISLVLASALALITLGFKPVKRLNFSFALFVLCEAAWALSSLFLRFSLRFQFGKPDLMAELVGFFYFMMGPLLFNFSLAYLNHRSWITRTWTALGVVALLPIGVALFSGKLILGSYLNSDGVAFLNLSYLGYGSATLLALYFISSLLLFWMHRHSQCETFLIFSFVFLILGLVSAIFKASFPTTSIANAISIAILGYGVITRQLFNPLKEQTVALQKEISEREHAEKALRESERLYRMVVDHALQGIIIIRQGKIIYANPTACQMTGYSLGELTSWTIDQYLSLVHPADLSTITEMQRERSQGNWNGRSYQYRFKRKDGVWLWLEAYDTPIEYDGWNAVLAATLDITERKRAEEALRESEKRYRSLFDSANDAIFLMEYNIFVDCNQKTLEMFGCSREQIIGHSPDRFSPPQQPDGRNSQEKAIDLIHQALRGEPLVFEWKHCRYDGTPFDAEVNLNRVEINGRNYLLAIVRDISERKKSEEQIKSQLERLRALHRIDIAISSSMDLNVILNVLLDQVINQLRVDAADILLLNPHLRTLEYVASRGFRHTRSNRPPLRIGEGYAGQAALERRIIFVPALEQKEHIIKTNLLNLNRENFYVYVAAPLLAKGQVKGVMEIFHRGALSPDQEWFDFLETLAGVTAIAIENLSLFNDLQRSNMELSLAYDATIEGWSRALDLRDKETEGHTQRVTEMTLQLAKRMGLPESEFVHLRWGALLHDIGKMSVPDEILFKPGPLTEEEWKIMHKHPLYAYEMLSPITFLHKALEIPYCHHEKWDGSGYPRGLKGDQIPLSARIFAIVDVWDALGSNRPYRPAWSEEQILEYIRARSGTHFDPQVVAAFFDMLQASRSR